jgi:conjugative transfer signal peptidase TraF
MIRSRLSIAAIAGVALILFGVLVAAVIAMPLEFNPSLSMPIGVYERFSLDAHPLTRGTLVDACMPAWAVSYRKRITEPLPPGPCPGNTAMVLKYVAGIPGDRITVRADGVLVNGYKWKNTAPAARSHSGFALPHMFLGRTITLARGRYWLLTSVADGFDSRYWGPSTQIMYRMRPLLILPDFPK